MKVHSFLFFILFTACSLFETRTPEQPDSGNRTPFIQPDRPEIVIENFVNAVRTLSLQNYLQCLDISEFSFSPSNRSAQNNPGIWTGWTYAEEQTYFTNLVSEASKFSGHQLTFNNSRYEILSEEEQHFIANYTLTINHNRGSSGIPTTAVGEIVLELHASSTGLWSVYKWTDISSGDVFSWSEFKAVFIRG